MFTIAIQQLSEIEKDALKETANVGCGNASIALSEILEKKVSLEVSAIEMISWKDLPALLGGKDRMIVGMYTPIRGNMIGNVLLIFDLDQGKELAVIIQGKGKKEEHLSKDDEKSLRAVGNVITDYYIRSLAQFLEMDIRSDGTSVIATRSESVAEIITAPLGRKTDDALILYTKFSVDGTSILGNFMLCLATQSITPMLKKLETFFHR